MRLLVAVLLTFLLPTLSCAWSGRVTGVSDGDTLRVEKEGRDIKVRLYGIDTPERGQAYGNKAKKLTNALLRGRTVEVRPVETDRYGRTVALVYVNGQSVNQHLLQEGYAWVYTRYCRKSVCSVWKGVELFARLQGRGIWADPDVIPPWEWRQENKKRRQ